MLNNSLFLNKNHAVKIAYPKKIISIGLFILFFLFTASLPIHGDGNGAGEIKYMVMGVDARRYAYLLMVILTLIGLASNIKYIYSSWFYSFVFLDLFVSFIVSLNSGVVIGDVFEFLLKLVFYVLVYQTTCGLGFYKVVHLVHKFAFVSLVFALVLFFLNFEIFQFYQPEGYFRIIGWFGNPNFLATSLGLGVLCNIFLKSVGRIKYGNIYVVILIAGIIMTASKTILVVFLLMLFIYFFGLQLNILFRFKISRKMVIKAFLSIISVCLLIASALNSSHIRSYFQDVDRVKSLSGRDEIWASYLNIYLESNFLDQIFGKGKGFLINESQLGLSAHSSYIKMLVENGFIYFVIITFYFVSTLFVFVYKYIRSRDSLYIFLFYLVFYFIVRNFTSTDFFKIGPSLFMFCFVLIFVSSDYKSFYKTSF